MIRNLTPHPVTLVIDDHSVTLDPDGPAARVVRLPDTPDGTLAVDGLDIPLRRTALGTQVTDLPDPVTGVTLIVARLVAEARPDRDDLVFVDGLVRDADGRVIGATALAREQAPVPAIALVVADGADGGFDYISGSVVFDGRTIGSEVVWYQDADRSIHRERLFRLVERRWSLSVPDGARPVRNPDGTGRYPLVPSAVARTITFPETDAELVRHTIGIAPTYRGDGTAQIVFTSPDEADRFRDLLHASGLA